MKTIQVIPNPYVAIDADGVPQGVVGLPGMRGAWIGAAIDAVASAKTGKMRFFYPGPSAKRNEKGVAGFRVVTLNVSDANVRATISNAVNDGSLIVVDKDEAAKFGIVKDFLAPEKALAREKEVATDTYRALKLDPKAKLADPPCEATPEPKSDDEEDAAKAPAASPAAVKVTANVRLNPSTEA